MPRRKRARSSVEQLELSADTGEVLAPFAAPFAEDVGAVIRDLDDIDIARAVVDACCAADAANGLTLAEIAARVDGKVNGSALTRRLRVFEKSGMLRPLDDRRGESKYVLDPRALAGLQIVERITTQGGVSELLLLLDRTAAAVAAGDAIREEVAAALERALLFFRLFADTLSRLTQRAPISELYAEVRKHENQRLLENLDRLTRLVAGTFAELEPIAHATVLEAQRYDRQLGFAAERVIAQGGAARDFAVLSPETWRTAAIHAPWGDLAGVGSTLVFDAPDPTISAEDLVAAVEEWRPRGTRREPPPELDVPAGPDPLALRRQQQARRRERLEAQMGSLLQDADAADITSILRGQPWPAAAALLGDVIAADRDPRIPVSMTLGDGLLADARLEVAWCSTPVNVARLTATSAMAAQPVESEAVEA